ncbi:Hypothetical protein MCYN_0150 [Mycoplasmopsis cynos C142]|uniref:Uncharacterized protein n=1 Tax=Mycoplasmopsis cynos (strain C142) TaxID=1246955 RepID=L0RV41_MYCC1|nr:Hypothetical protein MCYN_0150 [Mycoplasmopsis cynos C142]
MTGIKAFPPPKPMNEIFKIKKNNFQNPIFSCIYTSFIYKLNIAKT